VIAVAMLIGLLLVTMLRVWAETNTRFGSSGSIDTANTGAIGGRENRAGALKTSSTR